MNSQLETISEEDEERFEGVSENLGNLGFFEKMNICWNDGPWDDGSLSSSSLSKASRGENEGFQSSQMIDIEHKMYSASSYSVGGSSKKYYFRYGESSQDGYVENRFNTVEYTGDDRVELLKMIDELKALLNRSGEMADKPILKNPRHGWNAENDHYYSASQDRFSDSSSGINRPFVQNPSPDNHPGNNTVTSLDSEEPNEEGYQLGAQNAAFLAGIIKKSSKDFKSNPKDEQEKTNVTVNGSLLPARLIRNAQKVAGPIQPGNYWYDFQAGFWGVIGGRCRGIIHPFIEEFNHIMPENCAGGNTRVFVNGRELHQTDFKLLVKRGLPNERNKFYNIEISGRVLDAETGKELECLGKLAPTVEKVKHGFGMKTPKATA